MPQLSPRKPKLLDQMRDKLRVMHSVWKTEKTDIEREEKFLRFQRDRNQGVWRHPIQLGKAEVEQYLSFLAVDERVSASTQNQAFSAILFLYKRVLEKDLPEIAACRAQERKRLPVVPACGSASCPI